MIAVLCRVCAEDLEDLSAFGSSDSEASPPTESNNIHHDSALCCMIWTDLVKGQGR